jgi:hypothetical protein
MKMPNKKLSTRRYNNQSEYHSRIFDLMRHSLTELKNPGYRRFMVSVSHSTTG